MITRTIAISLVLIWCSALALGAANSTSKDATAAFSTALQKMRCKSRKMNENPTLYKTLYNMNTTKELDAKIIDYLEMHKQCSRLECLKAPFSCRHSSNQSCTYFFAHLSSGTGNSILSLISSIAYSLLTSRTFLVGSEKIKMALCDPIGYPGTWTLPPWIPERSKELLKLPFYQFLFFHHKQMEHQFFYCEDQQTTFSERSRILAIESNQYFLPALYFVPSFQKTLRSWFPDGDAFRSIAKHFIFLKQEIADTVRKTLDRFQASVKIGFQVRSFHPIQVENGFPCLIRAINKAMDRHPKEDKFVILMTSSEGHHAKQLEKYLNSNSFRGKLLRKNATFELSYETPRGLANEHNVNSYGQVMVEMAILGQANFLVATPQSTFGSVAANLGGVETALVDFSSNNEWGCFLCCSSLSDSSLVKEKEWLPEQELHSCGGLISVLSSPSVQVQMRGKVIPFESYGVQPCPG